MDSKILTAVARAASDGVTPRALTGAARALLVSAAGAAGAWVDRAGPDLAGAAEALAHHLDDVSAGPASPAVEAAAVAAGATRADLAALGLPGTDKDILVPIAAPDGTIAGLLTLAPASDPVARAGIPGDFLAGLDLARHHQAPPAVVLLDDPLDALLLNAYAARDGLGLVATTNWPDPSAAPPPAALAPLAGRASALVDTTGRAPEPPGPGAPPALQAPTSIGLAATWPRIGGDAAVGAWASSLMGIARGAGS